MKQTEVSAAKSHCSDNDINFLIYTNNISYKNQAYT